MLLKLTISVSACPLQEFAMGMSILAFLVLLKILSKRVKKLHWIGAMGPILACAIGIAAVAAGGLQKRGIKIVEKIPQGAVVDRTGRKGKYRGELAVWGLFQKHRTAGGEALSCRGACTEGAALKAPIHPVSQLSLPRPSCLLISQAPSVSLLLSLSLLLPFGYCSTTA
jgi:hypothetical protein